ncbi:MAG: hypothetical protein GY765_29690 [bacterium]|nr:hypothetical protein [bacterium]
MDKILIACREEYNQFDAGKTLSSGPIHSAVFIPLYYKGLRVGLIRCLNKLNNRRMVLKSGFRKDEFETLGKIGNIIAPLLANLIYKDKTSEMIRYMMKESASSNPDRTFFLILTCITSGKDLGFDRAVLFIKENDHLVIKRAVGPCNEAENQEMRNDPIWKELARKSVDQFLDLFKLLYDFPMESIPFFKDHAANSRDHYLSAKFDEEKPDLEIKESKLKEFLEKNFWSKPDNKNKKYILYSDFDKNDYAAFPYTSIMLEWLYRPGVRNGASGLSSRRMALKWAAVPLISRQKTIGWLYVDNVYSGAEIHLIDIDILLFFSNFITEVLKSTDGYRKSNKINELTSEITETADMNTIVRHTRQKLIGDDFPEITDVCILLKKKDDHRFTPGDKKNYKFIDDYYVSCSDGQLQYLEQEDNYLLFPGSGAIQMIVKEESRQAKSRLIVPVILGKHIVGYIIIDGPETNDYSDFDVERFKSLASHLGALLKKNREERKHEKHLRMLSHEIRSNLQTALTKFELMFRQDVVKPAEIVSKSKAGYYGIKDTIGMLQKFENVVSSKSKKAYHIVNLPLHTLLLSALRLPGEIKNAEAAHKMIIKADKKSFQTVLENLYDNALKYSQDNTRYPVEVSLAQPTADRIDIVFVNYGLKIKDTRRIFEEWHRELDDKYIRDKIKGSGLGLHIVKNIVREHGWGIKAESIPDSQKECYRNTFTLSIQIEAPPHKPHEEMGVQ